MTLEKYFTVAPYYLKKVRLEKGEIYPLHVKNPTLLLTEEEGFALSMEGERKKILRGEEMIFLPAEFSCLLSAEESVKICFLSIADPSFFFSGYISHSFEKERAGSKELFHTLTYPLLIKKFIESIITYQKDVMLSERLIEIKTAELFTLLKLLYPKDELASFFAPALNPEHYFKMLILSSYKKIKTVDEFSKKSGISSTSFNRQFHKVFGVSPYKWMIQKRIEALTVAILHSSRPLKEIAFEFEFSSLSHMIDFYKKYTGKTPGEIRKKASLQEIGCQ